MTAKLDVLSPLGRCKVFSLYACLGYSTILSWSAAL